MSSNPYVAGATTPFRGNFVPAGRGVRAGRGLSWVGEAWDLFKQAAGVWIGMVVVMFVMFFVAAFIPLVGPLATMLFFPVFMGGLMLGCRALEENQELEFAHLFAGFRQNFGTLVAVGALYLAGYVVVMLIVVVLTGASMFTMMMGIAFLLAMGLTIPLLMAVWLAAPLVVFHDQGAVEAMKGSFMGCLKNVLPFLVYGVIMFVLAIVASIPLALGWLVLGPMVVASVYTAYRDIYFSS
ncbi:MAG: uncharacterized protein K0S03_1640 [Burkholderiales bacterium]|nr:uncharacterized protein [Burkholderiales bacterium]